MPAPHGFSWVDPPRLAALSMPSSADDLTWLRRQGIDVLVSLTEDPPPRRWVNDAGLLAIHHPIIDMTAPSPRQLDHIVEAIHRATKSGMGVAVHCTAGKGRTGTVLAAYFVDAGMSAAEAIDKVRTMRPGSVETADQEEAVAAFAERHDRPTDLTSSR